MGGMSIAGVLLECRPCLDCLGAGDFAFDADSIMSFSWSSARRDFDLPKTGMRFLVGFDFVLAVGRLEAETEDCGAVGAAMKGRWFGSNEGTVGVGAADGN